MTELEERLLNRLDAVADDVSLIAVAVGKLENVHSLVAEHELRLRSLEKWQARIIGGYMAAAVLAGIGFQLLVSRIW